MPHPAPGAERQRTVAVLGASADRRKFGNKGLRAFVAAGWRVYPVNPKVAEIEGLPTVGSVADLAEPPDVVSFYVPPMVGVQLLPALALRPRGELWLNPGSASPELLRVATELGLETRQLCSILTLGYQPSDF